MIARVLALIAVLISAGLIAGARYAREDPNPPAGTRTVAPPSNPTIDGKLSHNIALQVNAYAAMTSRPPFSPSRRPYVEPESATPAEDKPAPPEKSSPQPPRVSLMGIIADGSDRLAVLTHQNTGETIFARRGSSIEGWQVELVDKDRIVLENAGVKAVIELY